MSELSDFHTLSTNSGVDSLTPSLWEEDWGGPGTPQEFICMMRAPKHPTVSAHSGGQVASTAGSGQNQVWLLALPI